MFQENRFVEAALRRVRYWLTRRAVRRFDAKATTGSFATGMEFFRMRSAMDIHPTVGKKISQLALAKPRGEIPTHAQALTSTFVNASEIDLCVDALREDGYYVFANRIPQQMVGAALMTSLSVDAQPRGAEIDPTPFPRSQPEFGRYDIDEDLALSSPAIQDFCSDPALARIASLYLEQPVLQDQVALWWTTPRGKKDASMNAWMFHQDRDRLSFLKFFCYLTDVGIDNGPHIYVRRTHSQVPQELALDGRKDDLAVAQAGLNEHTVTICGSAGTLIAVDSVGLHKGLPPSSGDRCVLQVEFATSLFGAVPDYPVFVPSELVTNRYREMPRLLQRWARAF